MANSMDPDQTAPIGAVFSWSTLFASILNSSVILGNYLQQTTSADNIFFLALGHTSIFRQLKVKHDSINAFNLFLAAYCNACGWGNFTYL